MVFPGPHAFLLVLGDVRNSGKEHYLLRALSEVFGQEVLDYSMVLFMHGYSNRDIGRNRCVRKCRERDHKRRVNAELVASNERESQLKSDNEKLQRELEQLKDNEKKREKNPRESKDIEEFLLTEKQVQEEYDIPRTLDRREEELLQTVTGSQHGIHISTAVTPPSGSEKNLQS
ncbi:hypothetical protein ABG768_014851 [Culter alburnus]|uniref:AIG1-type G domain-containing protein n=1 Tax=Culter alburnus TaxID=194366 RepID=A0AAW1Z4G7_CULAL